MTTATSCLHHLITETWLLTGERPLEIILADLVGVRAVRSTGTKSSNLLVSQGFLDRLKAENIGLVEGLFKWDRFYFEGIPIREDRVLRARL